MKINAFSNYLHRIVGVGGQKNHQSGIGGWSKNSSFKFLKGHCRSDIMSCHDGVVALGFLGRRCYGVRACSTSDGLLRRQSSDCCCSGMVLGECSFLRRTTTKRRRRSSCFTTQLRFECPAAYIARAKAGEAAYREPPCDRPPPSLCPSLRIL